MKKLWSGVIAASFVATVGLSAQQAPPAAPGGAQQPAPSAQATTGAKTVTLSGCIQNAPAPAAGAAASATAPKFVLSTKAGGATGAGAAVGTSGTATRYQLDGEEKAISPHLNHQVEITGTLQPAGAAAAAGATGAGPTLKVDAVKMVAATCS